MYVQGWFYLQLQKEREKILEYKRQVQSLVNKSKKIVQLKPRNPDYRSNKPIILRALCDYKQDQVCAVTQNAAKVFPFSMGGFLSIERAELNLGFWTSLFHKHNSQYSFQGIVCKKTFLNCPPGERKYKTIYDRLDKIRFLRNRVSHYERIIHWSDLRDQHDLILLLIKYMDNEFYNRLIPFDTFNDTINSGIDVWKEKASKFMQVQVDTELKQIQSEAQ